MNNKQRQNTFNILYVKVKIQIVIQSNTVCSCYHINTKCLNKEINLKHCFKQKIAFFCFLPKSTSR